MPIHEGGSPVVGKLPRHPVRPPTEGSPLFIGDRAVVDAWQVRARREARVARSSTLAVAALAVIATVGDVLPALLGLGLVGTAAALYPLLLVSAGSRAAQRPFEVHETGVWATERRRLLRFRRFVGWTDIGVGRAMELAPGRFHLELLLLDGSVLSSVPGELSAEAVEYIDEHAGHQVRRG